MQKKLLSSIVVLSIVGSSLGAAYKIPEQSTRSMALAGAYVAGADSADAAYFNPANMSWIEGFLNFEIGFKYIHLPPVKFDGLALDPITLSPIISQAQTEPEKFKFGISLTTPAGLSKRWKVDPQKFTAEEFTLKVGELNPTLSYKISSKLSLGAGIRLIYAKGIAKYQHPLAYKVDMEVCQRFATGGKVQIPIPSSLNFGIVYTYKKKTKLEFVFERTFWSAYNNLDFDFDNPILESSNLGQPRKRDWEDTNTFRFGITHSISDKFDLMFGYAIDETPIPELTLGFELPDSFGKIYSFGFLMHPSQTLEIGFAFLYVKKDDRYIDYINLNGIKGRFTDLKAQLLNISLGYKF